MIATFTSVEPNGAETPCQRQGHAATLCNDRMYVFSGRIPNEANRCRAYVHDFWCFDIKTKIWTRIELNVATTPVERHSHSLCCYKEKIYLFGGSNTKEYLNDLWSFDVNTHEWARIESNEFAPTPRHGHTATVFKNLMIIIAGKYGYGSSSNFYYNDTYAFDLEQGKWVEFKTKNSDSIPRRCWHTSTLIEQFNAVILFGGFIINDKREEIYYNDIWALDLENMTWKEVSNTAAKRPHERNRHIAVHIDSKDSSEHLIIHSGNYFEPSCGDVWLDDVYLLEINKDLADFKWTKVDMQKQCGNLHTARGQHTVVYNRDTNELLVFAGEYNRQRFNDILSIRLLA